MAYVLDFPEIDATSVASVGGKGANLGELARVDGVRVPDGFCVTTAAFRRVLSAVPGIEDRLDALSAVDPADRAAVAAHSAGIRAAFEDCAVPDDIAAAITGGYARLGADTACAVRSSATAEDLPTASFAGQQDTYLNVVGAASVLAHVRRCWASLFTERAVTYRQRNGFGHRAVDMAVVVQRMVFPRAAGILVTADPVTSDRTVVSVDAGFGLGEALVSGLVNADVYQVRAGAITAKTVATKKIAMEAVPGGGTRVRELDADRQRAQVLTEEEILRLAALGRRIEAHFGSPQDVEWCLDGDDFRIVQSRPLTTLFPIPDAPDDAPRVYVSVGHQQMMTDAMKPLGLSVWQLTSPAPMRHAGGRLFVDITPRLASAATRPALVAVLGKDPLTGDALRTVLERDFVPLSEDETPAAAPAPAAPLIEADPALVAELVAESERSVAALEREIDTRSGTDLLDFVEADIQELRRVLFNARSLQAITAGMEAAEWLNERLGEWLGEKNAADVLTQSVPGNVTSEMGLALLDVADVIRPHPEVVAYLRHVEESGADGDGFLDELARRRGGPEARAALERFLDRYGMRCVGEIDITRTRWSEQPTALVPTLLGNIANFAPGEGERRFEEGRRAAERQAREFLERVRALPDGARRAEETRAMIDRVRTFAGYREYPKYGMVVRYAVYKRALLRQAAELVRAGVLERSEDIYFLTFDELREVVGTGRVAPGLIRDRAEAFRFYRTLTPPRILTSDGTALSGAYHRDDLPDGALPGMAVSAGTVEGRARVVTDIARADLAPGDILVTPYTDPSWTPLFVAVTGLVTEVGGPMTHGAVIAREYGLPAVVGVENATALIRDGQRIRVHGTEGYVEILPAG
ncbi:rifamycin-inactivating phosphotransferase [Nocardia thailandica]|uniref:Rifamycin-inactivating phosphotransferase n=1 Tax=Nocardia thailandica TaxID=257275 RepID=A0ABW6PRM1_9NOCA